MFPEEVSELPRAAYLSSSIPLQNKRIMARFRLNGAPVRANTEHRTPYCDRVCRFGCQPITLPGEHVPRVPVENDQHIVLECAATNHIREKARYASLFRPGITMQQLMVQAYDPTASSNLASCISEMIGRVEGHPNAPVRRISSERHGSRIAG